MIRNNQGAQVSPYNFQLTKTVGGSLINTLDVPTQNLPGNFGIRVIEQMPTNLSDIYRPRNTVHLNTQVTLDEHLKLPELMSVPLKVDYPTDEDSDDNVGFSIKVSPLTVKLV
jgi:hypothetical protein